MIFSEGAPVVMAMLPVSRLVVYSVVRVTLWGAGLWATVGSCAGNGPGVTLVHPGAAVIMRFSCGRGVLSVQFWVRVEWFEISWVGVGEGFDDVAESENAGRWPLVDHFLCSDVAKAHSGTPAGEMCGWIGGVAAMRSGGCRVGRCRNELRCTTLRRITAFRAATTAGRGGAVPRRPAGGRVLIAGAWCQVWRPR